MPKPLPQPCFWLSRASWSPDSYCTFQGLRKTEPHCLAPLHNPKNPRGLHPDTQANYLPFFSSGFGESALPGREGSGALWRTARAVARTAICGPGPSPGNRIWTRAGLLESAVYTRGGQNTVLFRARKHNRAQSPASPGAGTPFPHRGARLHAGEGAQSRRRRSAPRPSANPAPRLLPPGFSRQLEQD